MPSEIPSANLFPEPTAGRNGTIGGSASASLGVSRMTLQGQGSPARPYGLTPRELDVLHLIAAGMKDREIAAQLGLSPFTASRHVANILAKMQAFSRTEVAVRAERESLLEARQPLPPPETALPLG